MKLNDSKSPIRNVKRLITIFLFLLSCTYSPEPPPDVTEPKASETPDCITTCLDLYEECREICRENVSSCYSRCENDLVDCYEILCSGQKEKPPSVQWSSSELILVRWFSMCYVVALQSTSTKCLVRKERDRKGVHQLVYPLWQTPKPKSRISVAHYCKDRWRTSQSWIERLGCWWCSHPVWSNTESSWFRCHYNWPSSSLFS